MLSEFHSLNLKLCSKQYNKNFVLHLIVVQELSSGWQHNYSTKTSEAGRANEQSMRSLMSMDATRLLVFFVFSICALSHKGAIVLHKHITIVK
jgi:hypothetical protein